MSKAEEVYKKVGAKKAFGNPEIISALNAVCRTCKGTGEHHCDCPACEEEDCLDCEGEGNTIKDEVIIQRPKRKK